MFAIQADRKRARQSADDEEEEEAPGRRRVSWDNGQDREERKEMWSRKDDAVQKVRMGVLKEAVTSPPCTSGSAPDVQGRAGAAPAEGEEGRAQRRRARGDAQEVAAAAADAAELSEPALWKPVKRNPDGWQQPARQRRPQNLHRYPEEELLPKDQVEEGADDEEGDGEGPTTGRHAKSGENDRLLNAGNPKYCISRGRRGRDRKSVV